jgi:hypothetical protein
MHMLLIEIAMLTVQVELLLAMRPIEDVFLLALIMPLISFGPIQTQMEFVLVL